MTSVAQLDSTVINYTDKEGNTLFEIDVIYVDQLLAQCQEGIDVKDRSKTIQWLEPFTARLSERTGHTIDPTNAYLIAIAAINTMQELKKRIGSLLT